MELELYKNDKNDKGVIRNDDLVYDGKKIIIPSYWVNSLCDFLHLANQSVHTLPEGDQEDFKQLKDFLDSIQEYNNQGN